MWWNHEIRDELRRAGLVHEFQLSYAASFEADPARVVYCEHGNEFDPANRIRDYADPLDTPLGYHIVTDFMPRLPHGRTIAALHLREVDRVFPLTTIPEWVAARLFYEYVTLSVRWLLAPLLVAYLAYETIAYALGAGDGAVDTLVVELGYDIALLLAAFCLFLFVGRRKAIRAIRSSAAHFGQGEARGQPVDAMVKQVRGRLENATLPVFVSGHTHAPSLTRLTGDGGDIALVNSGCWLRQLQPVPAHLGMPAVFVSRVVQTHVRVYRSAAGIEVELWEHPRPFPQRPLAAERLAIAGRMPDEPDEEALPRVRARTSI